MKITIGVASTGRAEILHETVLSFQRQIHPADEILICVADGSDCLPATANLPLVRVVLSPRGLPVQRNTILAQLGQDTELIAFFDDDVELHPAYLKNAVAVMSARPDLAAFSGATVADGFEIGPIDRETAQDLLRRVPEPPKTNCRERLGLYGCNMVVRASVAKSVQFDERLALYAFLEDFDFGERCKRFGMVAAVDSCLLVHLAVRSGRISSRRFGYAQVTNPLYLLRKGSVNRAHLLRVLRNVMLANLAGLVVIHRGRRRVDRVYQLQGNLRAVIDFVAGGAHPERVKKIEG